MMSRLWSQVAILTGLLLYGLPAVAQQTRLVQGRVTDADTKEPVSYATVGAPGTNFSTRTDDDGRYTFRINRRVTELRFVCVGYNAVTVKVPDSDAESVTLDVVLSAQTQVLKEVVVKPKKYRNKNNPAVELIQLVVQNRDRNRVENFGSFQEEQYEKLMMGVSNLSEKSKNRRWLRSWKFALENADTTKLAGTGVIPAYLQENVQDFYSQRNPKRNKTVVKATQKVRFPLMDDDGIELYLRYLYQNVDLYDNYVVLLTDHFLSPIANNAPLFYRYYPADTLVENGSKIVRLQFFPRNKTDMLLQGELYVALDSTYPVVRAEFTVNPQVNLNWVKSIKCEQHFDKMPESGKWILADETYDLDFGLGRRGAGIFGERYVSHRQPKLGHVIPDSIFEQGFEQRTVLETAERNDTAFWSQARHVQLNAVEAATYRNIDSLKNTRLFKNISNTLFIAVVGHWKPVDGIEIGRINTFYSFNSVEGDRFRFGGRTNPEFSKKVNLEGYVAYGLKDERWKFGIGANIAMGNKKQYNTFPYNLLRINYQQDLMTPGVVPIGTFAPTSLATSFTRGVNDRFFFHKKFVLQYEREFYTRFSYQVGFEHREFTPQGSLRFIPTDDQLITDAPVTAAKPYIQVRYAPGEQYYQTSNGWRQRVRFNYIAQLRYARGVSGILGSQYDFNEVTASVYKFSNLPPIGYNYFYFEAGGVFGKVPYPLLTVHRANQTFGYRFMAYNLMNFMEFVSDRYAAVNVEQSFYGFFTNKIPLVKRLKLREFATLKVLYGQVSDQNQPTVGSGLYQFPTYPDGTPLTYTLDKKPYVEASIGLGNIFKILRVDLVRRFTYLNHPNTAKYGIRVAAQMQF
jgi:hypothetical protein